MLPDDLTSQGPRLLQTNGAAQLSKGSLTSRVRAYRGKAKNKGRVRRAQLAGWFVNFQFSQVDKSGRTEAVVAEKQVCTVFVNQWAASGEKGTR